MYERIPEKLTTDVLVIGAGLAGVCAAVMAARRGCAVILLERFRTLGGNGGPDVGVHPSGAHRFHPYAAETGVMEEMIEEAAWRGAKTLTYDKHYNISQMWDGVLYDTLVDAGVKVLRCHYAKEPVVENGRITKVIVEDIATYHTREITVNTAVIDSSGDGNVSAAAGAEFRMGREAMETYHERSAPEVADDVTLGTSLVAYVRRSNSPQPFKAPPGTPEYYPGYEHSPTRFPAHGESVLVYPTETGGESGSDTIEDEHEIYPFLLKQLYAWWERGKREFPENENWELVWVSPRAAKRESRRFVGDYTLTQNDVENGVIFDDGIGFGGFAEDLHYPRPEREKYIEIRYIAIPPLYTIPYRSIYSKDIDNLFFASRLCSVSHLAHGTVRLQRTLSTLGMAAGVAAGLCKKYGCSPRDIYTAHMEELQQTMLREDITLMGCVNSDDRDLARLATVTADSFVPFGVAETDTFLPLDCARGVMLWDWAPTLDTFSCYLRNTSSEEQTVTAVLKHYVPERQHKFSSQSKKFRYFRHANQMEWGVDDTYAAFVAEKTVTCTVPAGFEGWYTVPLCATLSSKNPYNDDERYAVELQGTEAVLWSMSDRPVDFCRRCAYTAGEKEYTTYYDSHSFRMSPAPRYGEPENVTDGVSRRWATNPVHMWIAAEAGPQQLMLTWDKAVRFDRVHLTFDSLSRDYASMPLDCNERVSELLVKEYTVEAFVDGAWKTVYQKADNYHRFNAITFEAVTTDRLRITAQKTWGDKPPRIYEVRVYNSEEADV